MKIPTSVVALVFFTLFSGCSNRVDASAVKIDSDFLSNVTNIPDRLYGITVDNSWTGTEKLNQIIEAIKAMSVKPTVRIVMSAKTDPEEYIATFKAIHQVAYVMAQPVDSSYMKGYTTVGSYRKRFQASYKYLAPNVDIWEVANEINGEGWIGDDRQFNADKMYAAYKFINGRGARTAVTSFEFEPGRQKMTMLDWLQKYVPTDMKKNLDYLMVSYYEDDSNGFQPDWKTIFGSLQRMFPNSKLAIGECGNTAKGATTKSKIERINHYYTMPKYSSNYVGGYFWWTWVADCIPYQQNPIWEAINDGMKEEHKVFEDGR